MTAINRQPFGILGFLGIKNGGRNPATVADTLAPTWKYDDWYLNTNTELLTLSGTVNAVGGWIFFDVPADRVWWVSNFDVFVSTGVGEAIRYNLCRFINRTEAQRCVLTPQDSIGASTDLRSGVTTPMILAPGEGLGLNIMSITGTVDFFANVRLAQCPT